MKRLFAAVCLLLVLLPIKPAGAITLESQTLSVGGNQVQLQVPSGMRVEFVAELNGPRFIAMGPDDELLIGSNSFIYRVPSPYRKAETLVSMNGYFHSTAYRQGVLYAAETEAVLQAPYSGVASQLSSGDFTQVTALPSATGGHSSRTIVTGPDGNLYVGLGISGNCSDEYMDYDDFELRRGGVFLLDNTNTLHTYSSGLRNPIGLAFHPQTGVLFATNAGPDDLGFDNPPEVLARLSNGSFHGMPWFQYYDGAFHRQGCISTPPPLPVSEAVAPAATFLPRSTPEGIAFLPGSSLGSEYDTSAAVAIHGSWATPPEGGDAARRPPKLALVVFSDGSPVRVEDLVTGFQRQDGTRFARPCGIAVGADGNIYFTSDGGEVEGLFRLVSADDSGGTKRNISSVYGLLLDGS